MAKQPAKGRETPSKAPQTVESSDVHPLLIDAIPAEFHASDATAQPTPLASADPAPRIDTPQEPVETPAAAPETNKNGSGFLPLVLGGLAAGVIGFGVASLTTAPADSGLSEQVAAQGSSIAALRQQISGLSAPVVELSDIEAQQTALAARIAALEADMTTAIGRLETRTSALEQLPVVEGGALAPATAAYQAELDALRVQIAEMTDAAETRLETARAAAAEIEENAAAAARNAASRAALSRVQSAMESGAPMGAALADLEDALGESAPAALLAVQDGVPKLVTLRDEFPDAARAALAVARSEGVSGEEVSGFGAFLRDQLDVRSTTPREGNDADAVLSRAQAALDGGRLSDALAEISALPEVARAEMSAWLARAEARADALAAVDMLSTSLSDN